MGMGRMPIFFYWVRGYGRDAIPSYSFTFS